MTIYGLDVIVNRTSGVQGKSSSTPHGPFKKKIYLLTARVARRKNKISRPRRGIMGYIERVQTVGRVFVARKKKRALSLAELLAGCLAVWSAKATWWTYKCRLRSSIYVLRNRMSYQITKQLDCLDSFAVPGQGPVLLSPGIHSFPFKLGLPLGLPSTFLGKHGWVQYYCKAVSYFGLIYFNGSTFRTRHFGGYQSMMMARSISGHEIHHIIVINAAMCFWNENMRPTF